MKMFLVMLVAVGMAAYGASWLYAFQTVGQVNGGWLAWQAGSVALSIGASVYLKKTIRDRVRRCELERL